VAVVIQLGDYKGKETIAVLRELLVRASRGEVSAFGFSVEFKDGSQKTGFTGKYKVDPQKALKVANRMSQRLNAIKLRQANAAGDEDETDSNSDRPLGPHGMRQ